MCVCVCVYLYITTHVRKKLTTLLKSIKLRISM